MPDEDDPFEIARRLDEFGAGRVPRPPKSGPPAKPASAKVRKKKAGLSARSLALVVFLAAIVGWLIFQYRGGDLGVFSRSSNPPPRSTTVPMQSEPPKMIPSFDGMGEVPAFTVQVSGTNAGPNPSPAGTRQK